jgi:indole-3-glycerol phosphate synthase
VNDILNEIVENKKKEVEQLKRQRPLSYLQKRIARQRPPLNFSRALAGNKTKIIAEVKKASPSKGDLNPNLDHVEIARIYEKGGAAAISVLTESRYFKGSIDYLAQIKKAVNIPLLRKDFIFDPYQIYEARAYGADAVLLIVAITEQGLLSGLIKLARNLDLDCLVEVHNVEELERAIDSKAKIVGINNRNLKTFNVDIDTTKHLLPLIQQDTITISESGIRSGDDIKKLNKWKVNAALIGESLVTADDVLAKLREFVL